MRLFAIRGATTVPDNTTADILRETEALIKEIIKANSLAKENVVSIIFTTTPDLNADFPAKACRLMGWTDVPLLGAVEADVPHGLPLCIRVLLHVYLDERAKVRHIYLKEARKLRPDLAGSDLPGPPGAIGQIAIDGPAGSGKSTVAKLLAERLQLTYIDTGAMYRALTLAALDMGIPMEDGSKLAALAADISIELVPSPEGKQTVLCQGRDVTEEIRAPHISRHVSLVSSYEGVRREMVKKQQELAKNRDVVMDGRDIGTVVLPFAAHKFYLTASLEERTRRRYKELLEKGYCEDYETLKQDLEKRDKEDSSRKIGPLRPSPEADIIDTTGLTVTDVVRIIEKKLAQRQKGGEEDGL